MFALVRGWDGEKRDRDGRSCGNRNGKQENKAARGEVGVERYNNNHLEWRNFLARPGNLWVNCKSG